MKYFLILCAIFVLSGGSAEGNGILYAINTATFNIDVNNFISVLNNEIIKDATTPLRPGTINACTKYGETITCSFNDYPFRRSINA